MKIISSFSGGRTSAYMTIELKKRYGDDLIPIFANTGREDDKTLDFIHVCDLEFKLDTIWIEAKINPIKGLGTRYNVVDYRSACRDGSVFESVLKKYGIPNKAAPFCTRELKQRPIVRWIRDNIKCDYRMAIGIRADERKRCSKEAEKNNVFYPLVENSVFKYDINEFWRGQEFDLGLSDYQGNCKTCFKKSNKKLLMIAKEHPEYFDWNIEMERKYGVCQNGNRVVFFRGNKSALEMLEMVDFDQIDIFDFINSIDEDETSNCSESCEGF